MFERLNFRWNSDALSLTHCPPVVHSDPKGEKKAAAAKAAEQKKKAKAKKAAAGADLDMLLDAGLKKGKKK